MRPTSSLSSRRSRVPPIGEAPLNGWATPLTGRG